MRLPYRILPVFLAAGLAAVIGGCATALPTPTPSVITINFTPALRPFGPVFQTCTRMQPGLSLLVNELSIRQINSLPSDVILTWGESVIPDRQAFLAGTEELVFIVHPDNPVRTVSTEQLENLLSGEAASWSDLLQPDCPDCPPDSPDQPLSGSDVELFTFPAGDEALAALASIPGGSRLPLFKAGLAPDPAAMRRLISQNPAGLGFVPRRWLDDTVRLLEVTGLGEDSGRQPMLAYPADPQSPASSHFISCLQQIMNP